ncbi:MAG: hypothetical protein ACFFCD_02390 [Promethearchaeota archaeon]
MIHNVYILKKTGENLLHGYYGSIEVDESLITGFLSAISSFAEEIGAESVESLIMKNMKFVYALDTSTPESIIFAVCADREEEQRKIENILRKIKGAFMTAHKSDLETYTGDLSVFKEFYKDMDEIVWQYVLEKYGNAFQELITNKKRRLDEVVTTIHRLFAPKIATRLIDHILEEVFQ